MNILTGYKEAIYQNKRLAATGVPKPSLPSARPIRVTDKHEALVTEANPLFSVASRTLDLGRFRGRAPSPQNLRYTVPYEEEAHTFEWSGHPGKRNLQNSANSSKKGPTALSKVELSRFLRMKKIFPKIESGYPLIPTQKEPLSTSRRYLLPTSSSRYLQRKLASKSAPRGDILSPRYFTRDESTIKLDPVTTYQPDEAFRPSGRPKMEESKFALARTPYDSKQAVRIGLIIV